MPFTLIDVKHYLNLEKERVKCVTNHVVNHFVININHHPMLFLKPAQQFLKVERKKGSGVPIKSKKTGVVGCTKYNSSFSARFSAPTFL